MAFTSEWLFFKGVYSSVSTLYSKYLAKIQQPDFGLLQLPCQMMHLQITQRGLMHILPQVLYPWRSYSFLILPRGLGTRLTVTLMHAPTSVWDQHNEWQLTQIVVSPHFGCSSASWCLLYSLILPTVYSHNIYLLFISWGNFPAQSRPHIFPELIKKNRDNIGSCLCQIGGGIWTMKRGETQLIFMDLRQYSCTEF